MKRKLEMNRKLEMKRCYGIIFFSIAKSTSFLSTTEEIEMGINRSKQPLVRCPLSRRWSSTPVNKDGYEQQVVDGSLDSTLEERVVVFYFRRETNVSSR
ncbi:Hypothetical predicted protein [Olea europaea subsp. europaea]|uniref:Uncharacterized protein n=1 Tax=Olea europaea subsp. europaea TaxID=158383 RepID=A0A8S0TGS0_OLEEU|nr:Hypothetical predicted protein [Olea europaea subsp. europaea]